MARKPKAYSYVRFSSPEQQKGDSLRRQTEAAERYAAAHGLQLDRTLTLKDEGVSAYTGRNIREGAALHAFRSAIERGKVTKGSVLLVESLDRLSRQTARKALRELEAIIDAGVDVVTLQDGQRYNAASLDGVGLLMAMVTMMRAYEESATKSMRVRASWASRRKQYTGDRIPPGQRVPFWLRIDPKTRCGVLDPKGSKVAHRIATEYLKGTPIREIVRELNRDGLKAPQGGAWSRMQIRRTLVRLASKDGLSPLKQPARTRVRAALARRKESGRPPSGETGILWSLGRCGHCGGALAMSRAPKRLADGKVKQYLYLRCLTNSERPGGCAGPSHIPYDPARVAVYDLAEEVRRNPPVIPGKAAANLEKAERIAEAAVRKMLAAKEALEAAPSKVAAEALQETFYAAQQAEEQVDLAWEAARPGFTKVEADAIFDAMTGSDDTMNRALRSFLERVDVTHRHDSTGTITFRFAGGGQASTTYKVEPRKRAA